MKVRVLLGRQFLNNKMNKKNWLTISLFAFVALIIFFILSDCCGISHKVTNCLNLSKMKLQGKQVENVVPDEPMMEPIEISLHESGTAVIDDKYRKCDTVDDCAAAIGGCGYDCGTHINKMYLKQYHQKLEQLCSGFVDLTPRAYSDCVHTEPICEEGLCKSKMMN